MNSYIVKLYGKNVSLFSIRQFEAENEDDAVKMALSMSKKEVFHVSVQQIDKDLEILENESELIEHKGDILQQEGSNIDDLLHQSSEMEVHVSECACDSVCEDAQSGQSGEILP